MMDCYNRCLCATCNENDTCDHGCNMCNGMLICRFIIARGKCADYKPDTEAMAEILRAKADMEVKRNANANRSS